MQNEEMHIAFRFLIAALATWRIAFLLVREDGPGRICAVLRKKMNAGFFGQLLSCVKCTGMWVAIPFAMFVGGTWGELLVIWLAIAGVTALIDEWTRSPFEWQEVKDDELLRTQSDRADNRTS
jgi:hypothetical protein